MVESEELAEGKAVVLAGNMVFGIGCKSRKGFDNGMTITKAGHHPSTKIVMSLLKLLPLHSKLARLALGLTTVELASRLSMSPNTIARLERGDKLKDSTLATIRESLEAAGVIFIDPDDEAGPGIRLSDKEAR